MGFLNGIRNLWPFGKPLIRREPVTYVPIGVVRNRVREHRTEGWEAVRSDIFLREDLTPALLGIEGFSHVIVVFHMHRIGAEHPVRMSLPLTAENGTEIGLFATRVAVRPNPIGIAVVPLVWRRKNVLRVTGLDALDGSTVLDVKPYLPEHDAVAGARLPDWARQPMRGGPHSGPEKSP